MASASELDENKTAAVADRHGEPLSRQELAGFLDEMRDQPNWRREANKACDYYDGNQLDAKTLADMAELGMAPIIENLIGPTIDAVLGLEVKTRLDWQVKAAKDKRDKEVAEAMNVRLSEAERESKADRANSEAYASQIKAGIGWVEVSREIDPFKYPYRCTAVHRNEMWWDWRAKEPDLSDARYIVRRRRHEAEVLALGFPEHAELIKYAAADWLDFDPVLIGDEVTGLAMSQEAERGWGIHDSDWRDSVHRRVMVYEVWYRRWVRAKVLKVAGGGSMEYDPDNKRHNAAVAAGVATLEDAIFSKIRVAWFMGPHKLLDIPSPYSHGRYPYVPFFGKREDLTGVPYGLIRPQIPMQDEVNARNSKMVWLLSAKRVTATKGMVKDKNRARSEVARPDAWIELEPDAPPGGVFRVESDFALNAQQYQALIDKRESIKNVGGIYNAMMGQDGKSTSGIAINSLVEQSNQTLADINDNARFSRSQVGDLLLSLVIEDMGDSEQEVVVDGGGLKAAKTILLNGRTTAENGMEFRTNNVQMAKLKVVLADTPSTPSYRAQRAMRRVELVKSLPPQAQLLLLDFVIAGEDDPDSEAMIERLRTSLNLPTPGDEQDPNGMPQTPQQLQQVIGEAVQQALQQAGVEFRDREISIKERDAETRRIAVDQDGEHKVLDLAMRNAGGNQLPAGAMP